MALGLKTNIAALKAQRRLGDAVDASTRTVERLSSGLRINRAADDAAGLAIADSLNVRARVYGQAIRNINDGVSLINIAQSVLENLTTIVTRQIELAEQAANGTYSAAQRRALSAENEALNAEYNRIVDSAVFNGTPVFDTTQTQLVLQAGFGATQALGLSVGDSIDTTTATGTFSNGVTFSGDAAEWVGAEDLDGDGKVDLVDAATGGTIQIHYGNGDGTFAAAVNTGIAARTFILADMNNDGRMDIASADSFSTYKVSLNTGGRNFSTTTYGSSSTTVRSMRVADLNGDGRNDLIASGMNNYVEYVLSNGSSYSAPVVLQTNSTPGTQNLGLEVGDYDGDGKEDIVVAGYISSDIVILKGNGNGTFQSAQTLATSPDFTFYDVRMADLNMDGRLDIIAASNGAGFVSLYYQNANGTLATRVTAAIGAGTWGDIDLADLNKDGRPDIAVTNAAGTRVLFSQSTGGFAAAATVSTAAGWQVEFGDINGDGTDDLFVAETSASRLDTHITSAQRSFHQALTNISSQALARTALTSLTNGLQQISAEIGQMGAYESRLTFAQNNLISARENYLVAESRIRDVDVASEAAEYLKNQIRQQVSASILGQANQEPSLILRLLGSL